MRKFVLLISAMALVTAVSNLKSQDGLDVDMPPSINLNENDEKLEENEQDPFIKELADKTGAEPDKLEELLNTGYGRSEMISIILIHKKSQADLDELIKARNSMMSIRKISGIYGVSYKVVREEAGLIKAELEELIYSDEYTGSLKQGATEQYAVESSSGTHIEE